MTNRMRVGLAFAFLGLVIVGLGSCIAAVVYMFQPASTTAAADPPPPTTMAIMSQMPEQPSVLLWVPSNGWQDPPELSHGLYWIDTTYGSIAKWSADDTLLALCELGSRARIVVRADGVTFFCDTMLVHYAPDGTPMPNTVGPPEPRTATVLPSAALDATGRVGWVVDTQEPSDCTHSLQLYPPSAGDHVAVPGPFTSTGAFAWAPDASWVAFEAPCDLHRGCFDPTAPQPLDPPLPPGGVFDCVLRAGASDGATSVLWRFDRQDATLGIIQRVVLSPDGARALAFVGDTSGSDLYDVDLVAHAAHRVAPPPDSPDDLYAPNRKHWLDVAWMPDSTHVAVLADDVGDCSGPLTAFSCDDSVWLMSHDGSGRRRLGTALARDGAIGAGP